MLPPVFILILAAIAILSGAVGFISMMKYLQYNQRKQEAEWAKPKKEIL